MDRALLERILSCRSLPSLPAVALRVLELAGNPNVSMADIAGTVQNDPALAAKVLRTVNSSFFGLAQPCTTIKLALGYMGLNAVKSLVLGFSLVDCTRGLSDESGFDLAEFWSRAIFSATAARRFATLTGRVDPEEAFTGALFQDVGMLAAMVAIPKEYVDLVRKAPADHDLLVEYEQRRLNLAHPVVGSELTKRWKLPPQYVACVRFHHDPDGSPAEHRDLTRIVMLGRLTAKALGSRSTAEDITRLLRLADEWFERVEKPEEVLREISQGARELSKVFEKKVTRPPDVGAILAQAADALVQHQLMVEQEASRLREAHKHLEAQSYQDPLTGIGNRRRLDQCFETMFEEAVRTGAELAVVFCDADLFKAFNDTFGHAAGDAVLVELAHRLRDTVEDAGVVCRFGGEEFAVLLPDTDLAGAKGWAERIRRRVENEAFDLSRVEGVGGAHSVTISVGVAALRAGGAVMYSSPAQLLQAADEAVYEAKRAGRNCVRAVEQPASSRTTAPSRIGEVDVLLVEDDPLAAGLLQTALLRLRGVRVRWLCTGDAVDRLLTNEPYVPDIVFCDLHLGSVGGDEVVRRIRSTGRTSGVPIIAISCTSEQREIDDCLAAGATRFIAKADLCRSLSGWIATILKEHVGVGRAA